MKKTFSIYTLLCFLVTSIMGPNPVFAQDFRLPTPGVMVNLSPAFNPAVLKGIKLDPKNPFRFHFFVDSGDNKLNQNELKNESSKLIKYFLASLTIPEKDLWVNLSPYEKDRIVPQEFGQTEMGRDLLAEDYILKQITASLIYPESRLGKEFWQKVYAKAQAKYGTTNIPINTFNKVWIVPEKAVIYENGGVAFVLENHLKVMLEQDYLSLGKHEGIQSKQALAKDTNQLGSQVVREIVIPALTKEVNEGKNFSQLRQVFYSLILATWYKQKIKNSILNKIYSSQNKIGGINVSEKDKEKIYQEYLKAFKKGVYNYIKEEHSPMGNVVIPKKYFSGGVLAQEPPLGIRRGIDSAMIFGLEKRHFVYEDVELRMDGAMTAKLIKNPSVKQLPSEKQVLVHRLSEKLSILPRFARYRLKPSTRDYRDFGKRTGWQRVFPNLPDIINFDRNTNLRGKEWFIDKMDDSRSILKVERGVIGYEFVSLTDTIDHRQINYKGLGVVLTTPFTIDHTGHRRTALVACFFMSEQDKKEIEGIINQFPESLFYVFAEDDFNPIFKGLEVVDNDFIKGFKPFYIDTVFESLDKNPPRYFYTPVNIGDRNSVDSFNSMTDGEALLSGKDALKPSENTAITEKASGAGHKSLAPLREDTSLNRSDAHKLSKNTVGIEYVTEAVHKLLAHITQQGVTFQVNAKITESSVRVIISEKGVVNSTSLLEKLTPYIDNWEETYFPGGLRVEIVIIDDRTIELTINNAMNSNVTKDVAMNVINQKMPSAGPGGIDLNPAQMSMQVKKDGQYFKFDSNGNEIDTTEVTGATFTIRTMKSVTNLPQALGLNM